MNTLALKVVLDLHHQGRSLITNPHLLLDNGARGDHQPILINRTTFIEFHRFMFSRSDMDIQRLDHSYQQYFSRNRRGWGFMAGIEYSLLNDAIDYQLCIRSGDDYVVQCISEEIAMNWWCNVDLAQNFTAVTSQVLIDLAASLK